MSTISQHANRAGKKTMAVSIAQRRALIKKAAAERRQPRFSPSRSHDDIIVTVKREEDGQLRHGAVKTTSSVGELLKYLKVDDDAFHLCLGNEVLKFSRTCPSLQPFPSF